MTWIPAAGSPGAAYDDPQTPSRRLGFGAFGTNGPRNNSGPDLALPETKFLYPPLDIIILQ